MDSTYLDSEVLGEPTLDEVFADPIIRLIMKRDGVEEHDMRGTIDRVRNAYKNLTKTQ
ncbi:MAG: hypothetical protein ACOYNL_08710 [Rickettsiales bacterium]